MDPLLKEFRHSPILWLLVLVPVALLAAKLLPTAHTLLFVLSVLAIVPLAALLSHATESVAAQTGDTVGGLLNATLGNLTELVIAAAALRAGEYALVKGSIAGAIVTNTLFMLGASFFLGGLKHHIQEYNRATARLDAALLFLAAIALVSPSAIAKADLVPGTALTQKLSVALAVLLIVGYGLGLLFSLKTHREIFSGAEHAEASEPTWPIGLALVTLAVVTVLVALVSEVFVESVQKAAETFGMSQAFVGFIVVALVGGAAEMAVAFTAARKNRLDLSVGIALGSAFRAICRPRARASQLRRWADTNGPAILARRCSDGLCRHARRGVHYKQRAFGLVRWRSAVIRLHGLCHYALPLAAAGAVKWAPTTQRMRGPDVCFCVWRYSSCPPLTQSRHKQRIGQELPPRVDDN